MAAVISLAVGIYEDPKKGWIEGVAIIAAILIVAFVTSGNNYEKEVNILNIYCTCFFVFYFCILNNSYVLFVVRCLIPL